MKFSLDQYFEEGKKKGFDVYQITLSYQSEETVNVVNQDVESQTIGRTTSIGGRALLDGKVGVFSTDNITDNTPVLMSERIYESAKYGKEEEKENFYDGDAKYKKAATVLKEYIPASLKKLRDLALELSFFAKSLDKRIEKVLVNLTQQESESRKVNNLGLDCKSKMKCYTGVVYLFTIDEKGEHLSGAQFFSSFKDLNELREKGINASYKALREATDFFGIGPCKSKEYKVVLSSNSVSALLGDFVSHISAKRVMQHTSLFENKLNTKIASSAFTLKHTPHVTSVSASPYDAEGVPSTDFTLIDKGVLKTYLHSLETARHFNEKPNGCGSGNGNADAIVLSVKPGDYSQEELFHKVKNGLYITDISGLNSGLDGVSLNFSLPCKGYLIKDGELDKPVNTIIMAGNLVDLFNNISYVGSDVDTLFQGSIITPSIAFNKLNISGK